MEQKNNSRNYDIKKKQYNREDRFTQGNTIKQNKRTRDNTRIEERRRTNLGRQQNSLCRWTNLHSQ